MTSGTRDMTPEEERELIALTEKDDGWISSADIVKDRAFWRQAAKRTLYGKPYQTLINSILHKCVG